MHSTHDQDAGFGGEFKEHLPLLQLSKEVSFLSHHDFVCPFFSGGDWALKRCLLPSYSKF